MAKSIRDSAVMVIRDAVGRVSQDRVSCRTTPTHQWDQTEASKRRLGSVGGAD